MLVFRRRYLQRLGTTGAAAVLLSGLLVAATSEGVAATDEPTTPTSAATPGVDVGIVAELSTETSTTTRAADGTLTLEAYTTPTNYETASGAWEPIDNTLVEAPGAAYAVENAAGSYTASLPENPATTPVKVSADGAWVTMKMQGLSDVPAVAGNEATYDHVGKANSVTYEATNTGLKEDVILAAAPATNAPPLQYSYAVSTSAGLTPSLSSVGSVQFKNASGDVVMEMPRGNLVDSAAPLAELTNGVSYQLAQDGAGWTLRVIPDMPWLMDPARVYPVTIDPTLSTTTSKDCWIHTENPDGHVCGDAVQYLRVGKKPGDTYRSFLQFDVSSIPVNATVDSAKVSLYLDAGQSYSNDIADYGFQLPGALWDKATWNSAGTSGLTWVGGNPSGAVHGTRAIQGTGSGRIDFTGFAGLVQGWANGSLSNTGLVFKQVDENVNNVLWFKSSSIAAENDGQRPHLAVTYTPKIEPVTEAQGAVMLEAIFGAQNDVLAGGLDVLTTPTPRWEAAGGRSLALQSALNKAYDARGAVEAAGFAVLDSTTTLKRVSYTRLGDGATLQARVSADVSQRLRDKGNSKAIVSSWTEDYLVSFPPRGVGAAPFVLEHADQKPTPSGADGELPVEPQQVANSVRPAVPSPVVNQKKAKTKTHYDTDEFVDYMLLWTDSEHEDTYNHDYDTWDAVDGAGDPINHCADLVSQALNTTWQRHNGVRPTQIKNWHDNLLGPAGASYTWVGARYLAMYAREVRKMDHLENLWDAQPGDLLFADWDNDGDSVIDHAVGVTGRTSLGIPLISSATSNRHNVPLTVWLKIIADTTGPDPIFYGKVNIIK